MKKVIALTLGMLMMVLVLGTSVNAQSGTYGLTYGLGQDPYSKPNPKASLPAYQVLTQPTSIFSYKITKVPCVSGNLENTIDFLLIGDGSFTNILGQTIQPINSCQVAVQIYCPDGTWLWDTATCTINSAGTGYTYGYNAKQFFWMLNQIYGTIAGLPGYSPRHTSGNIEFPRGTMIYYPNGIYYIYFQAVVNFVGGNGSPNTYWSLWTPGPGYLPITGTFVSGMAVSVDDPC